ncbi:MAG: phosphatidate cytidylyltransferase [Dehalococcoidales bacterium]
MLKKRVITALWALPLLVIIVWFDKPLPWFVILAAVLSVLAVFEFFKITGVLKTIPLVCFGIVWTLLFIIRAYYPDKIELHLLLTSAVSLSLVMLVFIPKKEGLFSSWAWMLGGTLYIGWLLSYLVALRLEPGTAAFPNVGRDFVFLTLFTTFGSDTAAYFIGKAFGTHKLAPAISPGKTWEGSIAGVLGAVVISLLFTLNTPLQLPLSWWQAILLGAAVSAFGQLGDLAESLLKRNCGVKDSGSLMPGHGGILDRMDSIIFAGVVVYLFYIYVVV